MTDALGLQPAQGNRPKSLGMDTLPATPDGPQQPHREQHSTIPQRKHHETNQAVSLKGTGRCRFRNRIIFLLDRHQYPPSFRHVLQQFAAVQNLPHNRVIVIAPLCNSSPTGSGQPLQGHGILQQRQDLLPQCLII